MVAVACIAAVLQLAASVDGVSFAVAAAVVGVVGVVVVGTDAGGEQAAANKSELAGSSIALTRQLQSATGTRVSSVLKNAVHELE